MTLSKDSILTWSIRGIWFFQIVGVIGITFIDKDWFITKTPLNLLLGFLLLVINFPINSGKKILLTCLFFLAGMMAEWIGVKYGFLFGEYSYGKNLGIKIDGVPLLIGVNWAMLTLITAAIANRYLNSIVGKVLLGASLMVGLDILMEVSAPTFDFWTFPGGAPLNNYLAWFAIAAVLHLVGQSARLTGNQIFSIHLFATQVFFFSWFLLVSV